MRRKKIESIQRSSKLHSFLSLISLPIILSFIGLAFVFEASSVRSFTETGSSFYYLRLQSVWIVAGAILMLFTSFIDYHTYLKVSFFAMILSLILLIAVLIPGIGQHVGGARRWIDLGFFNLQPTELVKLSTILYLSTWFLERNKRRFTSFIGYLAFVIFLILMQPDMGTAIIIFLLSILIYIISGNRLIYLIAMLPLAFAGFITLVKVSPYRFKRLLAFFDPSLDPQGITYHITQILISLSNGGLFGRGYGASRQKFLFLPEAHTDSIFAIIGEEVGFVGAFLLICVYCVFVYKIYKISEGANDRFGRLLASGILVFFNLQILINLFGMVNLIPLTGVPLPFISYGGSHIIISFILVGILANVNKQSKLI